MPDATKSFVYLTAAQRTALEAASKPAGLVMGTRAHRAMTQRLAQAGLGHLSNGRFWIDKAGVLALRARPARHAWWHEARPHFAKASDVRLLRQCAGCRKLAMRLPKQDGEFWHASCLVEYRGWVALAELPVAEIGRMAVSDFGFLGLTIVDLEEVLGWKGEG